MEAEALVKRLKLTTLPIDPFEIARLHDIVVAPKPTTTAGVSGFLLHHGNAFLIAHATHVQNDGFIRFTVAHELGHYFLSGHAERLFPNGDGVHESRSGFVSSDPLELEADHFAAALLMPDALFRSALRKQGSGFPAIEKLSRLCGTSITATAIRFATYAEDPVAVIVSSGKTVDYAFLSGAFRDVKNLEWPRKGSPLPRDSATARFNMAVTNVSEGKREEATVSLDDWLDGAPAIEVNEDVVGLGSYGKTLTVLFTEEPLVSEEDEGDES